MKNDDIRITTGKDTIEIRDGRVFLNGARCGKIKAGDKLVFDADGQLFVNEEKR